MKQIRRVLGMAAITLGVAGITIAPMRGQIVDENEIRAQIRAAQKAMAQADSQINTINTRINTQINSEQLQEQIRAAMKATENLDMSEIQAQIEASTQTLRSLDLNQVREQMADAQLQMERARPALEQLRAGGFGNMDLSGLSTFGTLAFAPQQGVGVGQGVGRGSSESLERAREARDRVREAAERTRDTEQRKIDVYREGTNNVDEGRYERAISAFNRLLDLDSKWSRADGAYYWKAYALNKIGKRDEALAAVGEIQKQFPQSKWINDGKALQVEIQQAAGRPVSPDTIDDQDLKLLALTSLMNSNSDQAVPLVDGVLKDPKNNLSLKAKALYVLAQRPNNEKAREIVAAYAKNGSNPDLQIRAVGYLGTYRSKDSQQLLADIYAANNDVAVRRAVLRAMANSRDSVRLLNAVKSEQNVDLRHEAIRGLGNMQAATELGQLYSTETNTELKESILVSLMNARATDKLIEIAKTEKNADLRGDAIRYLANVRNEKAGEALASLYPGESDKNVKAQIIRSLGSQGAGKQLVDVTRNEKDLELKREGITWLGRMKGSKEATDYLMEIISK